MGRSSSIDLFLVPKYLQGLHRESSMLNHKVEQQNPDIIYRPIRPSDLEAIEEMHAALFPIRYETEFFLNVVNNNDIVSWGAVDSSRTDGKNDELIGFVTARVGVATEYEMAEILGYDSGRKGKTLLYILTLGVAERYRKRGIASSLVQEVIRFASSIPACRAVYLHVIAYNEPAILFYQKMSFQCLRRLQNFYYIQGRHHDSYLYVYYVNGGRSPSSPLDVVVAIASYLRNLLTSLASRVWKNEEKLIPKWTGCREGTTTLLDNPNRTISAAENSGSTYV